LGRGFSIGPRQPHRRPSHGAVARRCAITIPEAIHAKAELELHQFLAKEIHERQDYWDEIEDDDTCPRFYKPARRYVETIYPVLVEQYLRPDAADPLGEIQNVPRVIKETLAYLWGEPHHFGQRTWLWNFLKYEDAVKDWVAKPEKLSFDDFWAYVWIEGPGEERGLADRYHVDAVEEFWKRRIEFFQATTGVAPARPDYRDRRAEIASFLEACQRESKVKLFKHHLWRSVGHTNRRQFEYWQAESDKATDEDDRNFRRILGMTPQAFLDLLRRLKLILE